MRNKVLVELVVPEIDEVYHIYLPVNRKVGNIIVLLEKALFELTNGIYQSNNQVKLYSGDTGKPYEGNLLLKNTTIRNGSRIILF